MLETILSLAKEAKLEAIELAGGDILDIMKRRDLTVNELSVIAIGGVVTVLEGMLEDD